MPTSGRGQSGHTVFTRALRGAPAGEAVEVPKTTLRHLPPSYEPTLLGTPPAFAVGGAHAQYRGPYKRHVYERHDSWVLHRDAFDPRTEPLEHLITDAPEWGAGTLAAILVGLHVRQSNYARYRQQGMDDDVAMRGATIDGFAAGALAGVGAFALVKVLKALLREE